MDLSLKNKSIALYVVSFALLEIISYFAWQYAMLNFLVFGLILLISFTLSIYRLELGLLIVLAELFIGSMGHIFVYTNTSFSLSLRMALWLIILFVFLLKFSRQLFKEGRQSIYLAKLRNFYGAKHLGLLAIFICLGLANAYFRDQTPALIFNDFNSWLYWLLIFPLAVVYSKDNKLAWNNLVNLFSAAAIWLSLKTLFFLFVFTHNLTIASDIYIWLRRSLLGEMTPTSSGWPRIFIQGQIFSGIAFFLIFWLKVKKYGEKLFKKPELIILGALFISTLIISFSRSFWLALIITCIFSLIYIWRKTTWRQAFSAGLWIIFSLAGALLIIYSISIFPFPASGKFNADFLNRVTNGNEAALASRWSLLPQLVKQINREPFLGQGFGATVTYVSSDPRVLANNPDGKYTTYAFEWGYLDLMLKIGLLGTLSYLLLLYFLFKNALIYGQEKNEFLLLGFSFGLLFLAIINIFTPYLNHPLGIGILLLGSCLIQRDRVY